MSQIQYNVYVQGQSTHVTPDYSDIEPALVYTASVDPADNYSGSGVVISSILVSHPWDTSGDYLSNFGDPSVYWLAIVPNGESLSEKHYVIKGDSLAGGMGYLPANEYQEIKTKFTLGNGDKIFFGSSLQLTYHIFGMEM